MAESERTGPPNDDGVSLRNRIDNIGCGIAVAAVWVCGAVAVCIKLIRWGLS